MKIHMTHHKGLMDIYVRNWIYLRDTRTLLSENFKKIKDWNHRKVRIMTSPTEWVQANN